MDNSEIVDILELTGRLMELHDADAFRVRAYQTAAFNLDKTTENLASLSAADLVKQPGVGKMMAAKIREIVDTGRLQDLDELLTRTPEGVLEMFRIKGLGVKKIKTIWHELSIDNPRDLKIACENGQIAQIKGFGEKMQEKILQSLEFIQSQSGKVRMDRAEALANVLQEELLKHFARVEISGQVRRQAQEVDTIQLLIETPNPVAAQRELAELSFLTQNEAQSSPFAWRGEMQGGHVGVELLLYPKNQLDQQLFIRTATEAHLLQNGPAGKSLLQVALMSPATTEEEIYERAGLPYIVPEMRENPRAFDWATRHTNDELVTWEDLRGILHNHSTWSDGKHSLEQMALHCRDLGFQYFGIADHSQSASYAKGLDAGRVRQQQAEIDQLNTRFGSSFRIFKGTESDILGDGSLDFDQETLASFDYVVASVHQNLNMSQEKATTRLLKAIENPYTTILGHPTGRLLLARAGYPLDFRAIIDACAEHQVVIEINASPYRLDIDWQWIDYAMEQGVLLSINPDAHEMAGLLDMRYGLAVGRKGGLTKKMTFNALSLSEMETYLQQRKRKLSK